MALSLLLLGSLLAIFLKPYLVRSYPDQQIDSSKPNKSITWKELLNNYPPKLAAQLKALAYCESSHNPDAIGDSGLARGIFQYHFETFKMGVLKYNLLPYTETAELRNVWNDSYIQTKLTALILAEKNGWKHWLTCGRKIGLGIN